MTTPANPLTWAVSHGTKPDTRHHLSEFGDATWATYSGESEFGIPIPDSVILAAAAQIEARGNRVPFSES